jgi:hypothetical protein
VADRGELASDPTLWHWVFMGYVWRALQHTLRVPAGATARQVRVDGGIAAVVGLVGVVAVTLLAVALEKVAPTVGVGRALLTLDLAGYGLLVVGGYRLLTGRHPASEQHDALSSVRRIGTGILVVVMAMTLLWGLLLLVGLAMGWK